MPLTRLRLPPPRLLKRLPPDGAAGATCYADPGQTLDLKGLPLSEDDRDRLEQAIRGSETGCAAFATTEELVVVVPPFPLEAGGSASDVIRRGPLVALLQRRRSYAVFLLRLGGFSVGFFRGEELVDSKTDQRFVKGRNRKGGQSSTRFARIREKQTHELFQKACATARDKLTPYEDDIERVFLGGDRRTLVAFRKECGYFDRFGARLSARILPAHGDPRLEMLRAIPAEVWSSDVYVAHLGPDVALHPLT